MKSRHEAPQQTYANRRNHNTIANKETSTSSDKKFGRAGLIIAAALAVGGFLTYNHIEGQNAKAGDHYTMSERVEAKSVVIASEAIVRSMPRVTDAEVDFSNKLGSYKFGDAKEVAIETPSGVYIHEDANGQWYGIDRDDLKASAVENKSVNLDADRDGIVWINEQKAAIQRDSQ